jgi:acyl-CoA thioester hydrolase
MGHMNASHYIAAFDQAMWHLVLQLGFLPSWIPERRQGWADVRYVVNFKNELHAGQLFSIESSVVRIGNSSLVSAHRLSEAESGTVAAEIEMTSIYFDLEKRISRELPPNIRQAAQRMLAGGLSPANADNSK